jgi:phosphohistidine swiveling domain-containing protein
MNLKKIKEKLKKIEWYKQGVSARFLYVGYPWIAMHELTAFFKRIPVVYDEIICHTKHYNTSWYWAKNSLITVSEYFYEKHRKDNQIVHKLRKAWQRKGVENLSRNIKILERKNLTTLSNKNLLKDFIYFSEIYMQFWRESALHDAFDLGGEIILSRAIEREKIVLLDSEIHLLTAVDELTWPQKERRDFLKLVDEARKNLKIKIVVSKGIKEHAAKYHWILNHYAGTRKLDKKYFLNEIRQYLKQPKKYQRDKEIVAHIKVIKQQREKLIKKLSLSKEFLADLNFIMTLALWRDERKAYTQMADAVITKFSSEFSRRTGLNRDIIESLFWPELVFLLKGKISQEKIKELAKKRFEGAFFLDFVKYIQAIYGKEAEELYKYMEAIISGGENEVKGRPVFAGIARGTAKIIKSPAEFNRIKKGDILIAPNTRPEYLPIMKIAGAIVTEEGGLTCHAAIVSRELKIPCVVGAQGILSVIKDGDSIEVDANKGIIKIVIIKK